MSAGVGVTGGALPSPLPGAGTPGRRGSRAARSQKPGGHRDGSERGCEGQHLPSDKQPWRKASMLAHYVRMLK